MKNQRVKLALSTLALSVVALVGLRDTGVFVQDHTTTLYSGNTASFVVGEEANIIEEKANGYLVQRGNIKVTVPKEKISLGQAQAQKYTVKTNTSIISEGLVLRNLFLEETLETLEVREDVLVCRTEDGLVGEVDITALEPVAGSYVLPQVQEEEVGVERAALPNPDQDKVAYVIASAEAKLGTPYVYGAAGPNSYDCSGLVYDIFVNELGISVPRTSRAQSEHGTKLSRDQLQPGDLVFFNTGGSGVSHVGIYIGDDTMIHANTGSGKVKYDSLSSKYYSERFVNGARFL